jgi:phosphoribosylanthranilate isomerase
MSLKSFVKVGNITNLSDARYCAGMGVDMLGFCVIEGQKNYIKPAQFQEIRGWITGPLVVAEIYGLKNAIELASLLENYKPDYLEMSIEELFLFSTLPLPLILSVQEADRNIKFPIRPEYLLSKGLFKASFPLLIEIQSKTEVIPLLDNPDVKGFALHGTSEIRPGLKDYEVMTDVLELLELEN